MTDIQSKKAASSKVVYQNPWITVREDKTIDRQGNTGIYGYIESRDSCMVVVENDKKQILLVRAFRYPSKSFGWELPGGGGDNEDLLEASKRELEEETGVLARSWEKLGEAYVCNGLMTEKMAVCLAKDISFDGQPEDSDETFGDIRFFDAEEINQMILSGDIDDCQTLAGLQYYQAHLRRC